jgi:crotonobetainyl-CoA:carnitine CoA-transferase CaiB-like acyl-CoA transferase
MSEPNRRTPRLLDDLKIIDLTSMIAGPVCGRMFSELGANVIHVEPPWGDDGRNSTTPFLGSEGVLYTVSNRSKRGIVLDLRQPRGRELLLRMIEDADLFIQNMRPGVLDAQGLGYDDLAELNPRLIYVSVSGWGVEGPLATEPSYDVIIQAFSTAMRRYDDTGPPRLNGSMVGDPSAPLLAAFAAMAALRERDRTGRGSHVTTSLLQGALHMMATRKVVPEDDTGPPHERQLPGGAGVFQTVDEKWTFICAWNDPQFQRLAHLAGYPHLADDPAYSSRSDREAAQVELNELFTAWVQSQQRDELIAALRNADIPCAPVYGGVDDLMNDEHVQANKFVIPVEHPTKGRLWQIGGGFEVDGERGDLRYSPLFGEHTDEVLREHGCSEEEISKLRADGVVA